MKATIKATAPDGFEVTFETPDVSDRAKLLTTLAEFRDQLLDDGYTPVLSSAPAPVTVTVAPSPSAQSFAARELQCELLDKKPYWKVIGAPPYHKFGMRVWPETLEAAGIDPEKVDIRTGLDLAGWTAHFETRPGKDGKQAKVVVELTR